MCDVCLFYIHVCAHITSMHHTLCTLVNAAACKHVTNRVDGIFWYACHYFTGIPISYQTSSSITSVAVVFAYGGPNIVYESHGKVYTICRGCGRRMM